MMTVIPISKFQRHTKEAFNEAIEGGYKYVVNHNEGLAVVVQIQFFEEIKDLAEKYKNMKETVAKKQTKMHIDDFRGYFGKCKETSVELQHKALELWMKD